MINILVGGLPQTLAASLEARLEGAAVHTVDTGAEALEWLAGRSCQLLVLDQDLTGLSAIDVVKALTEGADSSELPVLYCLRRDATTRQERKRAERLGIEAFLVHPIDVEELAGQVRELAVPLESNGGEPPGEGDASDGPDAPGEITLGPGRDRIIRSLGRRVDVLDKTAVAVLEGSITNRQKGRAWREAHQIAEILTAFGRPDAARLARDVETLLERRGEPGSSDVLRFSELVVALRAEIERPVPFHGTEGLGDNRPFLLVIEHQTEFAESVGVEAEASGLRFDVAGDPEAARSIMESDAPAVVLMDLDSTADTNASIGFIAEISGGERNTPVIVTASAVGLADRVAVARAGGFALLRKPVSPGSAVAAAIGAIRRTDVKTCRVLAVDDDNDALAALRRQLDPSSMDLTTLDDPRRFWETLEAVRPDVVLLDMHMPHYSGLELCRVLRSDERWSRTTVIILGDRLESAPTHLACVAGADDFLAKPVVGSDVIARIANRLERLRVSDDRAGTDALTGLPTRKRCERDLERLVRLGTHYRLPLSVATIDVDELGAVNEACGHAVGDAVLRRLSRLLRAGFRVEDIVGRWSGEKFIVGAYGLEKDDCVRRLSELLRSFQAEAFLAGEVELKVHFSAGISALFSDGADLPALISAADDTLAQAKSTGRGRVLPAGWTPERSGPTELSDIVIVDKDAALAGLLQHAFEQNGWTTTWFEDAEAATAALCGPHPLMRAGVVLLEVDLPGRDGFSVLRALARDDVIARTRVLMITARSNESEVLKAFELGATDHVAKPFSVQVLLQRIRRTIRGS